jgi:hypothetical protein
VAASSGAGRDRCSGRASGRGDRRADRLGYRGLMCGGCSGTGNAVILSRRATYPEEGDMARKTKKATAVRNLKAKASKARKVRGGIIIVNGKPVANPRLLLPAVKMGDGSV